MDVTWKAEWVLEGKHVDEQRSISSIVRRSVC
jgi:hypothetical protein